jgi:glycosyltransferase involved in cell wall biosynthesis
VWDFKKIRSNILKRRITLLCSSFPPEKGAAPSRMYHLAKMLQLNDYEVTVICAMPNYPTGQIFEGYKSRILIKEKYDEIDIIRTWLIPTNSSNKIFRTISLLSYSISLYTLAFWQLLKSKPNLVYISSPPFITGFIGTKLARLTKAKIVLNISDLWPQSASDLGFIKEGWLYQYLLRKELKMYQTADALTVQSLSIEQHLLSKKILKKIFLYRNLQPSIWQANTQRCKGKRKIVYAGLLGIAQGVYEIIQAVNFAELDTELHIYGQGYELAKIEAFIKSHPENHVFYHGSYAAEKIPQILQQYHAMLVPLSSKIEGAVPSKIFNAIANGLPILFSGNGEGAEIVLNTQTGFVNDTSDFGSLYTNIKRLVNMSDEEYEKIRTRCIACSKSEFNSSVQDERLVRFLETV